MAEYVRDEFTRTLGSGWGTATVGGAWTEQLAAGHASAVVSNATGRVQIFASNGGASIHKLAAATAARDVALARSFSLSSLAAEVTLMAYLRVQAGSAIGVPVGYWANLKISPDGSTSIVLGHADTGGSYTLLTGPLTPAGTYVVGQTWRMEVRADGSPTNLRARIWRVGFPPDDGEGWVSITNETAGPQTAGVYQLRQGRITAPASALLIDISDIYVSDPPVSSFTFAGTANPRDFTFNGSASTGDIQAYTWYWGDQSAAGSGAVTSHLFGSRGMFAVRLRITTRWEAWVQWSDQVVVDYPEAGTAPGQISGPLLPSVLIDGVNVCDAVHAVTWSLGRTQWADPFQGQTASIRLRGRFDARVGDTVALSAPVAPNGTPLWAGRVDQVSMSINPISGDDDTLVTAMDVASWLGRWHIERGTKLSEHLLPARLLQLRPHSRVEYTYKWGPSVPGGRWVALKAKEWKADKLRERTYLDLINDALYASIAFAYTAADGRIVYGPWEPPAGQAATPLIVLDAGIDCAARVALDRNSPNGVVNRWTVGDGDNVDESRRTSIEDYGEHAITVSTGVLTTETSFPLTSARLSAMKDPADAASVEIPVSRIDQKAVYIEPFDFARFEDVTYSIMGVRHEVSLTDGWRCTLTLDRHAWATAGQSLPGAMSKPGPDPGRPEITPLEVAA